MKRLTLPALLLLTACGTPQEQCIAGATRDARVVNQLIAETEANIARGYAMESGVRMQSDWVDCTPLPTEQKPHPRQKMCFEQVPVEVTRPVAIDLDAERAKLASLRQKQTAQAAQTASIVAQCRALHPE